MIKSLNTPTVYTPEQLKRMDNCQKEVKPGRWVAARPLGWQGLCLFKRLKAAWAVFTGRADVLRWEGQ